MKCIMRVRVMKKVAADGEADRENIEGCYSSEYIKSDEEVEGIRELEIYIRVKR